MMKSSIFNSLIRRNILLFPLILELFFFFILFYLFFFFSFYRELGEEVVAAAD